MNESFQITHGTDVPVAAAAVHDGHALRPDVGSAVALDDAARLREEDPFTARWTEVVDTRLIGLRSRFEMDLNRPRDKAVYRRPEDAWGLEVWRESPLSDDLVQASLEQYDAFYSAAHEALSRLKERWGRFVVLDLHSYNHRRGGPDAPPADPAENPEVNIGTGTMDRDRWAPVVERLMTELRGPDPTGHLLDVRENVKFQGGQFPRWVHENFPESGCAIAVEFRKSFMDEWSGEPDAGRVEAIGQLLAGAVPGLIVALQDVN
ncbi:MAG: N-formylglutamate amidohydrolase [Gemmatimonadales bacterium]|nr:MAG: N-formylglutamate amidohydrolase [Gemmatimonadales bacterium]